ncbi:MAG: HAD family hydrolase [Acidimicrobiales bacterium]|jgi:2-haloalkanoic acid dehalogenase type II
MQLTEYEALSFDCYGTLIDWEAGLAAVLGPWACSRGLDLDEESLLSAYADHEARIEREYPAEPYPDVLARSFSSLGRQLGVGVSAEEAHSLAASVPDWPAYGDSHDALSALSEHFKLIILSNVDRQSFAASNRLLDVVFDLILTAEDIGSYKPAARNFEVLVKEVGGLGVAQGKLLHVAQSLFHDHVPAKSAGLSTVWINRRDGRPGWGATPAPPASVRPDWEFPSMAAFAAAVELASQPLPYSSGVASEFDTGNQGWDGAGGAPATSKKSSSA